MSNLPTGTWVVVADGAGARLFQNVGEANKISLRQEKLLTPQNLDDDGPSGSMPPDSSKRGIDEATFAKQLAHHLNAGALRQAYSDLVLVADPQTLGQMRPQLHKETQQRMRAEIAKTMTNASVEDIEKALS